MATHIGTRSCERTPRIQKLGLLLHLLKKRSPSSARPCLFSWCSSARQWPPALISSGLSFFVCGGCSDRQTDQQEEYFHMLDMSDDQLLSAEAYWHSILLERHQLPDDVALEQAAITCCSCNSTGEEAEIVPSSSDAVDSHLADVRRVGENSSLMQDLQEDCTQRLLAAGDRRRLNTMLDESPNLSHSYINMGRVPECAPKPSTAAAHIVLDEDVGPLPNTPQPSCNRSPQQNIAATSCASSAGDTVLAETAATASVSLLTLLQEESFSSSEYSFEQLQRSEEEEAILKAGSWSPSNVQEQPATLQLLCCVCMERHKGAALIPCGHTFCRLCPKQLSACPLCKSLIIQILDIF